MTIPDFQSLLSRNKDLRPSRITQIIPREAFKPPPDAPFSRTNGGGSRSSSNSKSNPAIESSRRNNNNNNNLSFKDHHGRSVLRSSGCTSKHRQLVFRIDRKGNAHPVSYDRAQVILASTSASVPTPTPTTAANDEDAKEIVGLVEETQEEATNDGENEAMDEDAEKDREDDVIEEIEGGVRHTQDQDDEHKNDYATEYYYIVGDDKLSCPYQYNSREYIMEQILGEGNRGSARNLIHEKEEHDTSDTDNNSDMEDDIEDTRFFSSTEGRKSRSLLSPSLQKLVIEEPSAVSMQESYLHYVTGRGHMNGRNNSSSSTLCNIRDRFSIQSRRRAEELAHQLSLCTTVCSGADNSDKGAQQTKEKHNVQRQKGGSILSSISKMDVSERNRLEQQRKNEEHALPPAFHEVELGDWEKQIDWEGYTSDQEKEQNGSQCTKSNHDAHIIEEKNDKLSSDIEKVINATTNPKAIATSSHSSATAKSQSAAIKSLDPKTLLNHPVNPYLDALDFSSLISWEGADAPPGYNHRLANSVGNLILEKGVAGSSIAKTCGAMILSSINNGNDGTTTTTSLNPQPFNQSQMFQNRMQRVNGAGVGSMGINQTDVAKQEKEIANRQAKRARMAIDKTNRVKNALGTLELGSLGRGRTITSSLMGPGGTERTGRPSGRGGLSSLVHDMEYVEELELVYNHVLVKPDMRKGELRQLHRPKLPRRVFRSGDNVPWQFQIQIYNNHLDILGRRGGAAVASVSGKDGITLNPQAKIRNEADLSPMEGNLVLLEYSEENPPIMMSKGMTCKIVNYYRGDRSKCPISVGGGDRPTRKKKHGDKAQDAGALKGGSGKVEKPPRLKGPGHENTTDLIGKIVIKNAGGNADGKDSASINLQKKPKESVTILSEGVTEILHSKVHGPFIGGVKDGVTQTGLISNVFAAPIFSQKPRSTDFLMILGKRMGLAGGRGKLGVVLRPLPSSTFCVGQVEPRVKVFAPSSTLEKDFMGKFTSYQIAKGLQRMQAKDNCGLKIDEIDEKIFPNTEKLVKNTLRQRIKEVAQYDKNTQIWTLKKEGEGDFNGVEALGRQVLPDGVAAYEMACAATQRLRDLGIIQLCIESNSATNVTAAMVYLSGAIGAARERKEALSKRSKAQNKGKQNDLYSKAEEKLKTIWKDSKRKGDVARYIHEELLLAPWHLTSEFIDVHKDEKGTGMMELTGLGDPSGRTEAFNFLRVADARPNKGTGNTDGALNTRIKKITGTENDLRKLNMKQMAEILRSYGMGMKEISKLKRWDRVHVIRDLSTKAASDKMGDGFERYARGEKEKLSEQRERYRNRIQVIWEKQRTALTTDAGQYDIKRNDEGVTDTPNNVRKGIEEDTSDDDSDFFDDFEKEEGERGDLIALQTQHKEERIANAAPAANLTRPSYNKDRKVIRRKITKKYPDGSEKVHFKFIVQPMEVEKLIALKKKKESKIIGDEDDRKKKKKKKIKQDYSSESFNNFNNANIGHALFEDDDEEPDKTLPKLTRKGQSRRRPVNDESQARVRKTTKKKPNAQKPSHRRMQKRKRAEEEKDLYISTAKRKGNSNRRERGSARERMPHVILRDRLEQIRSDCEKRECINPFLRPVDKKKYPKYYEVISNPIDLQTIRDKIQRYDYKQVDGFINDFEIMMNNAVKFNGLGSSLGVEATSVYEFVKNTITQNRAEFDEMERAVRDQMAGRKKNSTASSQKDGHMGEKDRKTVKGTSANVSGTTVYLGDDLRSSLQFDATTSNSDEA